MKTDKRVLQSLLAFCLASFSLAIADTATVRADAVPSEATASKHADGGALSEDEIEEIAARWAKKILAITSHNHDKAIKEVWASAGPKSVPILIRMLDYEGSTHTRKLSGLRSSVGRKLDKMYTHSKIPLDAKTVIDMLCRTRFRVKSGEQVSFVNRRTELFDALLAKTKAPQEQIRKRALELLGPVRNRRAIPVLIAALKAEKSPALRRASAGSLKWMPDESAIKPLVSALRDSDAEVRAMAAYALILCKGEEAVPVLLELLKGDPDAKVRASAAAAIGSLGNPKYGPALLKATYDKVSDVQRMAVLSLGER
ncbi:MAG: HEAT repeat domain-containing protein, partial [Phycisphaerae bacterium]|nr:HEAT repeat domain-containing protein [Phycisphaerae bacterium]